MNRKRKINAILNKKLKKMNAKMHHNSKPKYISKAERAKLELEKQNEQSVTELEQASAAEPAVDATAQ